MFRAQDFDCKDCTKTFEELLNIPSGISLQEFLKTHKSVCQFCGSDNLDLSFSAPKIISVQNSDAPGSKMSKSR